MDRSSRQKIKKETISLNATLDQLHLIDIYRTFHPKTAEYTLFSSTHETFPRKDHMLGHKTSLDTFNKTEILSDIFSDHKGMKLEKN